MIPQSFSVTVSMLADHCFVPDQTEVKFVSGKVAGAKR